MEIVKKADIKVTFFAVGQSLVDATGNFTPVYREAIQRGHQASPPALGNIRGRFETDDAKIALHSMTHPKLEALSVAEIDGEFSQSINTAQNQLGVTTKYFRAPFGTDGALTRQRLEAAVGGGSKVINWVSARQGRLRDSSIVVCWRCDSVGQMWRANG